MTEGYPQRRIARLVRLQNEGSPTLHLRRVRPADAVPVAVLKN